MATYPSNLEPVMKRIQRNHRATIMNVRMSCEPRYLYRKSFHNMIAVHGTATIRLRIAMMVPVERCMFGPSYNASEPKWAKNLEGVNGDFFGRLGFFEDMVVEEIVALCSKQSKAIETGTM